MDSVQAQDYANLIHIVIDNASTDATPKIIERYAQARVPVGNANDKKAVSIWRELEFGDRPGAARREVLSDSPADDLMGPDFIRRTVEVAERHPEIVVVGCVTSSRRCVG